VPEGVDLVRNAVRRVMQELIEAEATEQIGAARYERINTRVTERNRSRPRLMATQTGDIELRIPKLRKVRSSRPRCRDRPERGLADPLRRRRPRRHP
jgi:transposase-like protein